jgi:hypothetical protein
MVPISKCVPEDDGYHVAGALVVAPERAMQYAITQLRRAIVECGDFSVFIITLWARYASQPYCTDTAHVTNFQDPDFLPDLLRDLKKQKFQLRKGLAPATVLDGVQLVCGDSMEKKVQTMRAGWASDPVHPSAHIYAKMALNLIEKVSVVAAPQTAAGGSRKRSWSSSNRDDQETDNSGRYRPSDRRVGGSSSSSSSGCSRARGSLTAAAEGPVVAAGEPQAAAWTGRQGAEWAATITMAVEAHLIKVEAAAAAEVPESMPVEAAPADAAGTTTRRSTPRISRYKSNLMFKNFFYFNVFAGITTSSFSIFGVLLSKLLIKSYNLIIS